MADQESPRLKAARALATPALVLLIVGCLSAVINTLSLFALPLAFVNDNQQFGRPGMLLTSIPGTLFQIGCSAFVFYGALQMRAVRNYGICMAAAIAACIPCLSPCCLFGIPFGIWALVQLNKPEVRAGFDA